MIVGPGYAGELPDGTSVIQAPTYVLHFDADGLPPVDAFWSLTMYDDEGFQVANELDRFALGVRHHLIYNSDGSLDIYIQHENPRSRTGGQLAPRAARSARTEPAPLRASVRGARGALASADGPQGVGLPSSSVEERVGREP